jgi:Solute carrier family 35
MGYTYLSDPLLCIHEDDISLDSDIGLSYCFLSCAFLHLLQGVLISVGGLGMLVGSDLLTDKNYPALNKGKGDAFMIIGATLYGICKSGSIF